MPRPQLRDHRFLGMTQSLCPACLDVIPAKIISREGRVYFRKRCSTHGVREDFVCSDERLFDSMEYSLPGRVPSQFAVEPDRGCPYSCGLCTEHEQHTCVAVLEITSSCNLTCPMCYAASGPGGQHLSYDECCTAINHLVEREGQPEILQLSGGEPTVHPQFQRIFEYACDQPIDIVMVNTNGVRIAKDDRICELLASRRNRIEVYLQFDGFDDVVYQSLRGEPLLDVKMRAIERLAHYGINTTLVCTVDRGNLNQVGQIAEFGMCSPAITGASFQPATYVGRYQSPESLDNRVTFPDVIEAIVEQSGDKWRGSDFLPLPCAHPNAHSLAYAYREEEKFVSLARLIDVNNHLDLLANGITFNRQSTRELIDKFLSRAACGSREDCGCGPVSITGRNSIAKAEQTEGMEGEVAALAKSFFARAISEDLAPADVFRITTTSFMDAYNFDLRQLMKSCVHHLLPSGHLVPFSAYNVLYREGHVALPPLREQLHSMPKAPANPHGSLPVITA